MKIRVWLELKQKSVFDLNSMMIGGLKTAQRLICFEFFQPFWAIEIQLF